MITHVVAFYLLLRPQPKAVRALAGDAAASLTPGMCVQKQLNLKQLRLCRSVQNDYGKQFSALRATASYMWWDLILHGFWDSSRPVIAGTWRGDPSKLDAESRILLDVLFETLTRILAIPNRASQLSALHGLGHLYHPQVHDAVQQFIDTNPPGFSLKWLEQCRDCNVM
jgi:hypothetical protein